MNVSEVRMRSITAARWRPGLPKLDARPRATISGILMLWTAVVAGLLADDWIAGLAVPILWAAWHYLPRDEESPALALPLTMQWTEVMCGIFYYAVTGRQLAAMVFSDYRPTILIG